MNEESFYTGKKLLERISGLKSFSDSVNRNSKLYSHIVICGHDGTKNISIPNEFMAIVIHQAIELANKEIEKLQSEFDAL